MTATAKSRILVVDDEPAVRQSVALALELEDFDVEAVEHGLEALQVLADRTFDAVVLDVSMPYIDGIEVCRRLRAADDRTPVLMLTARDAIDDRVAGLDAGADDYLVKPFALRELGARLRALMRRAVERPRAEDQLEFADLRLDRVDARGHRGDTLLELTRTEFLLLECFLRHPRQVLTRSQIFEQVWGYDFGRDLELARRLHRLPAPQDSRRTASRGCCTRCAASATSCARRHDLPPPADAAVGRARWRSRSCSRRGSATSPCAASCAREVDSSLRDQARRRDRQRPVRRTPRLRSPSRSAGVPGASARRSDRRRAARSLTAAPGSEPRSPPAGDDARAGRGRETRRRALGRAVGATHVRVLACRVGDGGGDPFGRSLARSTHVLERLRRSASSRRSAASRWRRCSAGWSRARVIAPLRR